MEQKKDQLLAIHKLGQQIVSTLSLDVVLNRSVNLIQKQFNWSVVAIFLAKDGILELRALAGDERNIFSADYTQPATDGIRGWVYSRGEAKLVNNVAAEPLFLPAHQNDATQAQLCLPIEFSRQIFGVLDIHDIEPDSFFEDDVPLLEMVVDNIAVAINNARLYRDVEEEVAKQAWAGEALQESEERFRQVVASISAHVYVTELTEDEQLINHYISPNVEVLTGFPHKRFITDHGFWPNTVIYPADRKLAASQLTQLKRGRTSTVEYRLTKSDGEIIWIRDSGRTEIHGHSKMIYGVVSDVTDRKEAEYALKRERSLLAERVAERTSELSAANAKLARAARLKDEFLANMSHELRTPLNAILGMSEVLQSGVYGELNAEQFNAAKHIVESGSHLLALITDILDLSKIEAEKLELDIGPVYIDYVCEASLRMITQIARKKRIKVLSEFDNRVSMIQVDQRRLKQILVNLLSNAVKFTPEGGQIGLYVQGDTTQSVARFIVWDTGIGIEKEYFAQLFKPFVQLDSKLSRAHEGTGLGLSLVSRLAELHGGGITVESEVDKGSRFIVSLPWHEAENAKNVREEGVANPESNISEHILDPEEENPPLILLAEDNEANVITLTEFLSSLEYRVIVARNGNEAVKRATEEQPDIVLMDIQMPGMDGLEATRTIRDNTKLKDLPIIALTALAMPGDRERCLEAGANNYLSKPVSLKNLVEVIERHLAQSNDNTH